MTLQLPHPPAWMNDANCAQVGMSELWFPEHGGPNLEAKAVCGQCDVRAQCLEYAISHKEYGVWGGQPLVAGRRIG